MKNTVGEIQTIFIVPPSILFRLTAHACKTIGPFIQVKISRDLNLSREHDRLYCRSSKLIKRNTRINDPKSYYIIKIKFLVRLHGEYNTLVKLCGNTT